MVQKCDRTVSCPPKKWYKNGLNVPTEPKSLLQQIRRVEILTENEPQKVVFDRRHFREHFNTEAYLKVFLD